MATKRETAVEVVSGCVTRTEFRLINEAAKLDAVSRSAWVRRVLAAAAQQRLAQAECVGTAGAKG